MNLRNNFLYKIIIKICHQLMRFFYPIISKKLSNYKILNINQTIDSLINSNKSISRFGDGEIRWILGNGSPNSFEMNSPLLSKRLLQVLCSNNKNLEIGLPDRFRTCKPYTNRSNRYWKLLLVKYGFKFIKYLNKNTIYYSADITRPYIDYKHKNRKISDKIFKSLKKIWNNRNILIVEGIDSRLGVGNDLFDNTSSISRIECPVINAFESYNRILRTVKGFLNKNKSKNFLTLIALGPTATILAYDLSNNGYRALDVGHIDVEYEWFLMKANDIVNIPTRYVNDVGNSNKMYTVHDNSFNHQIVYIIK